MLPYGGVGVNAAAFIGYRLAGVKGAIAAIAGITIPTFIIVCLLSAVYSQLADQPKVIAAMKGINGAVIALILVAAYRNYQERYNWQDYRCYGVSYTGCFTGFRN